ncbi:MAG: acetyl-CoA carboxylase biotin carboxylase subunit [Bacteroidetes bacterium]|nr:acetyl-CoA carboxylase biotin carboxylase subunit [Bacteroidota bacterium]
MPRIKKILIANRGEIALRIMRTCRVLGLHSVAIYSEADRESAHVVYADEAYCVGPPRSLDSYLNIERIIEIARLSRSDAVHPGYGFLSERAEFAHACNELGVLFIGPPAKAISDMGDKVLARQLMQSNGIPVIPGTPRGVTNLEEALTISESIGYPVLVKAAAGGGGKGMRKVHNAQEMKSAIHLAKSEASSSFGDERIFIEKYLDHARHIEFQILSDSHGNCVHLFERECSIQRRHQKLIEEAPATIMTENLRTKMGAAAIQVAEACNYVGAGTIEFLLDRENNFYFMEMNTRLQVEHPVTEYITGLDLVAEQISIAEGKPIKFTQSDLSIHGHAIECRIYAEDPDSKFLPSPGIISFHQIPAGVGVRIDSSITESGEVPIHYDPLISKVITWGVSRDEATMRMIAALGDYFIAGVKTTRKFCRQVMKSEAWQQAQLSTHFLDAHPDLFIDDAEYSRRAVAATKVLLQKSSPKKSSESSWRTRVI